MERCPAGNKGSQDGGRSGGVMEAENPQVG